MCVATCTERSSEDSFGVFAECDREALHPGLHHGWIIGHRKMIELEWADGE